jgi:hypothetical protein
MHHAGTADSVPSLESKIVHKDRVPASAGTTCGASVTAAMFRFVEPCFRLHKAGRLREAKAASGGRGWLFEYRNHFPRKGRWHHTGGLFAWRRPDGLGKKRHTRHVRHGRNSVHDRRTTDHDPAVTGRAAFASATPRKSEQIETARAARTAPQPSWSCRASRIDQQQDDT